MRLRSLSLLPPPVRLFVRRYRRAPSYFMRAFYLFPRAPCPRFVFPRFASILPRIPFFTIHPATPPPRFPPIPPHRCCRVRVRGRDFLPRFPLSTRVTLFLRASELSFWFAITFYLPDASLYFFGFSHGVFLFFANILMPIDWFLRWILFYSLIPFHYDSLFFFKDQKYEWNWRIYFF